MNAGWFAVGFGLGVLFTIGAVWLPSRARLRQQLAAVRDTFRIESGLRATPDADLADARGAFAQAQAAYFAIYPGPKAEPDPAWLRYIEQWGPDTWADRQQIPGGVYRPQHLTVEAEATVALDPIDIPVVQPGGGQFPSWRFPTWGPPPTPPSWGLAWRLRDWPLVPLALVFAFIPPRQRKYPWWQKIADRVWEAGVVFEVSAQRVNRRGLVGLDDFTVDCVGAWQDLSEATYEIWLGLVRPLRAVRPFVRQVLRAAERDTPAYRPKRYYPIKEG